MSKELLQHYENELAFIRDQAALFAQQHPASAEALKLDPGKAADPHVERMIQAFAYLNARTRQKLDDEFPELTETFLGVLYPHYQAPIPSFAIVQLELDREQKQLTTGQTVPRHTGLETEPVGGEPIRFRTCYPVTLWPIEVQFANLSGPPFAAPITPKSSQSAAVLRLTLKCWEDKTTFSELDIASLRFFLLAEPQHVFRIYELVLNNTMEVALATAPDDPAPAVLGRDEFLRPVGFGPDEGMLPYSARSFPGFRLLTEYFTFPQKFLFFEIDLAGAKAKTKLSTTGNQLEVFLFLSRTDRDLERVLSAETFRLGCTPIVNLYSHQAEPLKLSQTEFEYRVRPDNRRPLAHEIYTIERVTASGPNGQQLEYRPFFSMRHAVPGRQPQAFWYSTRKPGEPSAKETREADRGTEVFISLVDLAQKVSAPAGWTLGIEATCLNRDLPTRLPFRAGHTELQMSGDSEVVARALCVTRPTPTLRPALRQGALWRLISHLSLNYLSLGAEGDKGDALREMLKLYDFKDSAETHKIITSILNVSSRPVVGRIPHPVGGTFFCRGVEVAIHFEAESGTFLFASVLERFLALYCTINSFSKLVATVKDRDGVLREWPPRVGEKILV